MHAIGEGDAQGGAGRASHRAFRLSFCFSTGRCFYAPDRKTSGKKQDKMPLPAKSFPERGGNSGDIRTISLRDAEKKNVRCGKRHALVRKTNVNIADFWLKSANECKIMHRKPSCLVLEEKRSS